MISKEKLESAALVACGIGCFVGGLYSIFFSSLHPLWGFFLACGGVYIVVAVADWSMHRARRYELGKRERALWSSILRLQRSSIGWWVGVVFLVIVMLYFWPGGLSVGGESESGLWSCMCPVLYVAAVLILAAVMLRHMQDHRRGWL